MVTGKKPASDASKQLKNPKSSASQKEVAASDLSQAKKPKSTKPKSKK